MDARPPAATMHNRLTKTAALVAFLSIAFPASADPPIVERVVAVIGERPILLSEVIEHVERANPNQAPSTIGPTDLHHALGALIDDALIEQEADRQQVRVSDDELDRAVAAVGASNGLTVEAVYSEAQKSGMSREAYRKEIARTLREHKLLQLTVTPNLRIEEADVRAAYEETLVDARRHRPYRLAWLVLRIPHGASNQQVARLRARAELIVREVNQGKDFAQLVRAYSDDHVTKANGGDLGERVPNGTGQGMSLRPDIESHALRLGVGETSAPIRLPEGFVILHLLHRADTQPPSYDAIRESIHQRLYAEALARARASWLRSLRTKTPVDVRVASPIPQGPGQ